MTARGLAIAAAVAAGCSFHTRSDQFECDTSDDCMGERECLLGWCVQSFEAQCPAECTACDETTCLIECDDPGSCAGEIDCPEGYVCIVRCEGSGSCSQGIDCRDAEACAIHCIGPGSCRERVECGGGPCDVNCSGINSCSSGIDCIDSCRCETDCGGPGACATAPLCPARICFDDGDCSPIAADECDRC